MLEEFFSHSDEHPSGWGMAVLDGKESKWTDIEKEDIKASDSSYLKKKMEDEIVSGNMIAHIRRATIGSISPSNNHPFMRYDISGRRWILAHNGTIFHSEKLDVYREEQEGTTDSERILLYIVDRINRQSAKYRRALTFEERFAILDQIAVELSEGNKLNLIIYDGEYYYIHMNQEETLHVKKGSGSAVIATTPLDSEKWEEIPLNQLQVYRNGEVIRTGTQHAHTYIYEEEQYRDLFMAYADL